MPLSDLANLTPQQQAAIRGIARLRAAGYSDQQIYAMDSASVQSFGQDPAADTAAPLMRLNNMTAADRASVAQNKADLAQKMYDSEMQRAANPYNVVAADAAQSQYNLGNPLLTKYMQNTGNVPTDQEMGFWSQWLKDYMSNPDADPTQLAQGRMNGLDPATVDRINQAYNTDPAAAQQFFSHPPGQAAGATTLAAPITAFDDHGNPVFTAGENGPEKVKVTPIGGVSKKLKPGQTTAIARRTASNVASKVEAIGAPKGYARGKKQINIDSDAEADPMDDSLAVPGYAGGYTAYTYGMTKPGTPQLGPMYEGLPMGAYPGELPMGVIAPGTPPARTAPVASAPMGAMPGASPPGRMAPMTPPQPRAPIGTMPRMTAPGVAPGQVANVQRNFLSTGGGAGDLNHDGVVNALDLSLAARGTGPAIRPTPIGTMAPRTPPTMGTAYGGPAPGAMGGLKGMAGGGQYYGFDTPEEAQAFAAQTAGATQQQRAALGQMAGQSGAQIGAQVAQGSSPVQRAQIASGLTPDQFNAQTAQNTQSGQYLDMYGQRYYPNPGESWQAFQTRMAPVQAQEARDRAATGATGPSQYGGYYGAYGRTATAAPAAGSAGSGSGGGTAPIGSTNTNTPGTYTAAQASAAKQIGSVLRANTMIPPEVIGALNAGQVPGLASFSPTVWNQLKAQNPDLAKQLVGLWQSTGQISDPAEVDAVMGSVLPTQPVSRYLIGDTSSF